MKKIDCCQYFREKGELYNFDDKLVFIFGNAREFITDCFVYPSGRPDNELKPPGERVYGVTVFAELDHEGKVFKTTTFSAGDNYLPFEGRAAVLRSGRRDLTIEQSDAFLYARRKPFMCDGADEVSGARAFKPVFDSEAYQYGATRIIQISVARPATNAFLDELQRFAGRKQFQAWRATGSLEGKEFSLGLLGDKVLIVAANAGESWRIGFYRRTPTAAAPLPPAEMVDALVGEISAEVGKLDGVALR